MKLRKGDLTLFYLTLADGRSNVDKDYISLADARIRDALATKIIFPLLKDFEEARIKIYEAFAEKDKDGNFIIPQGGAYQFKREDGAKVAQEVKILEDEEVEFKVENPVKIKLFIENTKYQLKVGESVQIDELLTKIGEEQR